MTQVSDYMHEAAWQITPRFYSIAPQITTSLLVIVLAAGCILVHKGAAGTLSVFCIILVVTNPDLEVLEPLCLGSVTTGVATKIILQNEERVHEVCRPEVYADDHLVIEILGLSGHVA